VETIDRAALVPCSQVPWHRNVTRQASGISVSFHTSSILRRRSSNETCNPVATAPGTDLSAEHEHLHAIMLSTMPIQHFIDLSHTVSHGLITYKGLPAPIICDFLSREQSRAHYAPATEFQIGKIEMVANTGTYLDSPFHRYQDGKDLSELELASIANLDGVVVSVRNIAGRGIDARAFQQVEVQDKAILIHTGWDSHWRTDRYFKGHQFITKDVAQFLADKGAALVGIDSYNIDDTADLTRPAHSILLGAGIPIVEHMCNLKALPDGPFKFFAVPVKVKGMGTFPVRAFAIVG
jgi:arylformamidase